jgi:hypothetical protein
MKVFDLGEKAIYQFRVNIPFGDKSLLSDVQDWIVANKISGAVLPGVAFFSKHEDVILFMLRWS